MNPKQDRPGARTPADLERKYNFGENFHEIKQTMQQQNTAIEKQGRLFSNYVVLNDKALQDLLQNFGKLFEKVSTLEGNLKTMGDRFTEVSNQVTAFDSKVTTATDNMCKAKAGFIYPFGGGTVPDGFLLCNGSSYSRTAYPELFAAIGTTWGAGDGSTTFNVPNLAERVPVGTGSGYSLGDTGGEKEHSLTVVEMPRHAHGLRVNWSEPSTVNTCGVNGSAVGATNLNGHLGIDRAGQGTALNGGSQPHNNMQPYAVFNYIIATGKTFVNTST